jgi:hypothetical protein
MAAGVTDRLWEMGDVVDMLDAFGAKQKRAARPLFEVCEQNIGAVTTFAPLCRTAPPCKSAPLPRKAKPLDGSRTSQRFGFVQGIRL